MTNDILTLVQAVIDTANNSYNLSYGWSEILECWTGNEIAAELRKEKIDTKEAAINHFAWIAKIRSEHASEIESTIW